MRIISRRGFLGAAAGTALLKAQDTQRPVFRVKVDMVVLSFTVTDSHNRYINGLKNTDFKIYEDGILQKMATFAEGTKPPMQVLADGSTRPLVAGEPAEAPGNPGIDLHSDAFVGTNVFVLFDTSNFMYRGFVYAEDAIADFVRGLDRADSVAVYTFSRNLSRAAPLTHDHFNAIAGLRKSVAGACCWRCATPPRSPAARRSSSSPTVPTTPVWWRPTTCAPWPKTRGFRST